MTDAHHRASYSLAVLNSHPIQYFAPLYRRLAGEPDIDITLYFCSRSGLDSYEDEGFGGQRFAWDVPLVEGYDHVFLRNLMGDQPPAGFWSLANPGVLSALRRHDYDAVWIHGHAYASHLLGVLGAALSGSVLFMRCETHLQLERSTGRRLLRRVLMPAFYGLFDACLAIGTRNAEFYRHLGVSDEKIFLVPYAVENSRFEEGAHLSGDDRARFRRDLNLPPPEVPVILFLSKLTGRKRPLDLLQAFRRVRRSRQTRAALAFVGAGPEEERLKRYAVRHEVPDVHFLGFRNQSELPAIYGISDVFVLPSQNEPWGLVVNEAMCAGLPIVVTEEVGAAADLVREGENGFSYPTGNVRVLADRLARLVSSPSLRRRMGELSSRIIGRWDLEACVRGIRQALRATCGDPVLPGLEGRRNFPEQGVG